VVNCILFSIEKEEGEGVSGKDEGRRCEKKKKIKCN